LVFGSVVAAAAGPEVPRTGVAARERAVMVQVAGSGGSVAGWEDAGAVPGDHQLREMGGGPVSGGAVIDDLPEDRVDHQPPPRPRFIRGQGAGGVGGDRAVAVQPARFVLHPGQGLQVDDHADGRLPAMRRGQLAGQPAQHRIHQHICAALLQRPLIVFGCHPGGGVDLLQAGVRVFGGQQRAEPHHAVPGIGDPHIPVGDRALLALLHTGGVQPVLGAFDHLPQLRQGLLRRPFQHLLLERGQHRVRQHERGLGDRAGLQLTDPALQQQPERARQPGAQLLGIPELAAGGHRRQTQRAGDLLLDPPILTAVTDRHLREHLLPQPVQPRAVLLDHQQRTHPLLLRQGLEVDRTQLNQSHHGRAHRHEVVAHELPEIQHLSAGVLQPGQIRPDPHPTPIHTDRRRLAVRVVLQRRQLPPGEILILIHVRYVTRTSIRTQELLSYFMGQIWTGHKTHVGQRQNRTD